MDNHDFTRSRQLVLRLGGMLLFLLVLLGGRLGWLHLTLHEEARASVARRSFHTRPIPAARGEILDRHGRALVVNAAAVRLEVWPPKLAGLDPHDAGARIVRAQRIAERLAPVVDAAPDDLVRRLMGERNSPLGAPVSDPATQLWVREQLADGLRGLDLREVSTRRYPWGAVAGNLLGFLDHEGHGDAGLERGLDTWLTGVDGERVVRVDHRGVEIGDPHLPERAAHDGLDVTLTLDVQIQRMVEEELLALLESEQAEAAVGVVMDCRSGDLLALASVPTLDPDVRSTITTRGTRFSAVQDVYAPGSSFKPLMMAAAIDLGLAHPTDPPLDCSSLEGRPDVRDSHPQDHPLTLPEILIHSSNIGMAKLLRRLTPEDRPRDTAAMRPLVELLERLGLGRDTGLQFPAEAGGRFTPPEKWTRQYTLAALSFGQELALTAVQMTAATNALADGLYRPPRLVRGVTGPDGRPEALPAVAPTPVFRETTARTVRGWMREVVEQGACAEVRVPGLPVAGKTGTADLEDDLSQNEEMHSFVALLPADDPVVTVLVGVRKPQKARYASQSAAPAAGRLFRRLAPYLGLGTAPSREDVRG